MVEYLLNLRESISFSVPYPRFTVVILESNLMPLYDKLHTLSQSTSHTFPLRMPIST